MRRTDVAIVGGGVIGLSVAYALSRENLRVTVFDQGPLGRAASWAGAGILAPPSERPSGRPEPALRDLSARLFPKWSAALREETGLDNGYRPCGGIEVALDDQEATELEARARLWQEETIEHRLLDAAELAEREPALSRRVALAYLVPGRAQIRNPRHLRALEKACGLRGVELRPDVAVDGMTIADGRIVAIRTRQGAIAPMETVIAAGAWSESILGEIEVTVPTPPVKGQMVLLHRPEPTLTRIVEHGDRYLVPRDDGHILVGATEEHVGFDVRPTASAIRELIAIGERLCPALADAEFRAAWAGLRPGNADDRPTIGRVAGFSNLIVATGHRRAGLQLSTGTAAIVASLVLGRMPPIEIEAFRPGRPPSRTISRAFLS